MIDSTPRLHVPMLSPADVIPHLAKRELHWRSGYSAHALATTWFRANGLPPAVRAVLETHHRFRGAELIDAILERKTDLRDGVRGQSHTDLLAILGLDRQLGIAAVEGKVDETFGPLVSEWLTIAPAKQARFNSMVQLLVPGGREVSALRYQLFHRTASAVYEGQRYRASTALVLVHSFCARQSGWTDFKAFVKAIGMADDAAPGAILGPKSIGGVELYAAWVSDSLPAESLA
jgi:hypothetical protein